MKYDLEGVCQDCIYLEKIRPLFEEKDKEIERLSIIINKAIKYCKESNVTMKSYYFINLLKILEGDSK